MGFLCFPCASKKSKKAGNVQSEAIRDTSKPPANVSHELIEITPEPVTNSSGVVAITDTDSGIGLKVLYDGENAETDIIAIHGLNGHREKTFTAANGVCWLSSLLPERFPNIRVMSYGYDARTHGSESLTHEFLHGHAEQLVQDVTDKRMDTNSMRRPIIFIAHSLGGLVLKSALNLSSGYNERHREDQMDMKISTYGILFMGTPHSGGQGAKLGQLAVNIASIWLNTNSQLLKHLENNSEWLDRTQMLYVPISSDFDTKFFYEAKETPIAAGRSLLVVPKHSACIPGATDTVNIVIQKNHVDMVKYPHINDEDFQKVSRQLKFMLEKAGPRVEDNWRIRSNVRRAAGIPQVSYSILPQIPFSSNRNFTGREHELKRIHEILQRPVGTSPHRNAVALYGMGGVGKTQIATHYAYSYYNSYTSIWWVNASSTATLSKGYVRIAQELVMHHARQWGTNYSSIAPVIGMRPDTVDNITGKILDTSVAVEAVKSWLGAEENKRWLLIVDNYDDIENVNLLGFIPNTTTGNLIVTSRVPSSARLGEGIEVKTIAEDDGVEILRKCAQIDLAEFDQERAVAGVLVGKLWSLPLALDQAGSFIYTSGITITDYLTRFDEEFPNLMGKVPPKGVWQYDKSTFTTWEISFEALGKEAQELLLLCAFFDNDEIWLDILLPPEKLQKFGIPSVNDAIREITSLSLAKRKSDKNALWIHPSVHRWSRERPGTNREKMASEAIILTAAAIECSPQDRKPENWILERQIMPHINACADHACRNHYVDNLGSDTELLGSLFLLGHALVENHAVEKAGTLLGWLVPKMEKSQGVESTDTLTTIHYMAKVLVDQGKYGDALKLNRRVLAGREKILGMEDPNTLSSLHNIALNLKEQGKYGEALEWYRRALAGKEKVLGKEHQSTLGTLGNMASVLESQGRHEEAMSMYVRVLAAQEKSLGEEHPHTLNTIHSIALVYDGQAKYKDALEWNHRALAGREKVLGMDHLHTLTSINNIGLVLKKQENYDDALEWYYKALAGRERILGKNHPQTLTTVNNIAVALQTQGKYEEALKWHTRALEGRKNMLGKEHPLTLQSYNNMAVFFSDQKRYEDALEWHGKALAGKEKVLGKEHPSTLSTVHNTAVALYHQGRYEDATERFERVLACREKTLGSNHPSTKDTRSWLASCKTKIEEL